MTLLHKFFFAIIVAWALCPVSPALGQGEGGPTITNNSAAVTYEEGSPAVNILNNVSIQAGSNILMATLSLTGNYNAQEDRLLFEDNGSLVSYFDPTSGTLRIFSLSQPGASAAEMETVLEAVRYINLNGDNLSGRTLTVNINVTDVEERQSNTSNQQITINAVNNAPNISAGDTSPVDNAQFESSIVFPNLTIEDVDSELISGAVISISEGYRQVEDALTIGALEAGISVASTNGNTIVLSGNADKESYATTIERITFQNNPRFNLVPTRGKRRVELTVTDEGGSESEPLSRFMIVQRLNLIGGPIIGRLNLPPFLNNTQVSTNRSSSYQFSANDFSVGFNDANGDAIAGIVISSFPEHGRLLLSGREISFVDIRDSTFISADQINTLVYEPEASFSGEDRFSWNARDQSDFAANSAQVLITVNAINRPPQITAPTNIEVDEDEPFVITGIQVSDPDQEILQATLEVDEGVLSFSNLASSLISFEDGENGEADIEISGPSAHVAFALSRLIYQPNANFTGDDALEIEVSDDDESAEASIAIEVIFINDAPVLANLETQVLEFEENEDPVRVTSTLTVSDDEDDQIISATISISEGFAAGQDILSFDAQGTQVGGDYDEDNGILTLTGSAPTSVYQTILRTVTYVNNSNNPTTDERIITFIVTDDGEPNASSEPVSRAVQVIAVNDPPVLANLESGPISYDILDNEPVSITNALTIIDVDNTNLSSATISFEEGYNQNEDLLVFTNNNTISASWDEDDGVLTLSGTATVAQYQQAIRSVTYQNTGEEDDDGDESKLISIVVSDGSANSNTLTREIIIITNDPPIVTSFSKTVDEDQALSFIVADFLYEDPDNGPNQDGLQSIAITVLPANGVLVVGEDTITTEDVENSGNGFGVSAAQISELQYLPFPNFFGTDSFGWNAFDGAEYAEEDAEVNITITSQPDAPVPSDFAVETPEDQVYTFTAQQFADAAPDPDGDPLAGIIIRAVPENGILRLNNITLPVNSELNLQEISNLSYVPNENYNGQDAFSWAATDGTLTSEQSAQVLITITPVNDAPIITSFTRAIGEEETVYNFVASDFTENYLDIENTPLTFIQITSLPNRGALLLNGSAIEAGTQISAENIAGLQYQAAADQEVGIMRFGWNASDGTDLAANPAQVTIIIGTGVTDFSISTNEDTEYTFSRTLFANNYGNPDGSLQRIRIETLPLNGTLFLNEEAVNASQEINAADLNQLSYLPAENYFGEDSLSWNASDGEAYAPVAAQILITVVAVNDPPTIQPIPNINLLAGGTSEVINISIDDQETEAEELTLTAVSSDSTIIPTDEISLGGSGANRTITLTTVPETRGTVIITLIVSDGEAQAQQQFTVTVAPYLISFDVVDTLNLCVDEVQTIDVDIAGRDATGYTLISECDQEDCSLDFSNGSITLNPLVSTIYYLSVEDTSGIRSNVDTLVVNIIDCANLTLEIPTAFTPDGDQANDVWEIENIQYATNVVVEVFDRYGAKVFSSEGYQQAWDGTSGGSALPVGTYYYLISVDGVDGGFQTYKGSVTILR